ncbi:unnamed protein product [Sphagnum jensenii]|uniref:Uncharacterized protein n=1 Tax=Sphagnum jensenii TaxID=128206 RepID=A0ABP1AF70_9BRYO
MHIFSRNSPFLTEVSYRGGHLKLFQSLRGSNQQDESPDNRWQDALCSSYQTVHISEQLTAKEQYKAWGEYQTKARMVAKISYTFDKVPHQSSAASDPAILEWMKQPWDSRTAGSLAFPANPRFKIYLVRYKDVIHRYYSENMKIEKRWIADLEEENVVAIERVVYELVQEATKLTDAMGEVYIPY